MSVADAGSGHTFPLSAVVGQDEAKTALLLNAVDPRIGGVLLRGQKGSAKTTLARGLAAILGPGSPFVELPVGATEDRLVGTLDLTRVLTTGERRFEPGLLAAAHGGVLYVDEINLLPDHLVDVLLDVAVSGINRVEREGVSHTHPSRFVLVGSMNPEEGELRPQLLDRFGLAAHVRAPDEPSLRALAVRRRLAWDADPDAEADRWREAEAGLVARMGTARPARLDDATVDAVSVLCASVGAEGLRADLTICRAAAALAGWEGRADVGVDDVRRVAPLALGHRARHDPLDPVGLDAERLADALDGLDDGPDGGRADGAGAEGAEQGADGSGAGGGETGGQKAGGQGTGGQGEEQGADGSGAGGEWTDGPGPDDDGAGGPGRGGDSPGRSVGPEPSGTQDPTAADRIDAAGETTGPIRLPDGFERDTPASGAGAGGRDRGSGPRGRTIRTTPAGAGRGPVAVGATVRAAAERRGATPGRATPAAGAAGAAAAPLVEPGDLRIAVREERKARLVVLVVDASGSMGAESRMAAAKATVLGLLVDAYQRRDLVALISFRGDTAEVLLRPTGSVEVARARLGDLPTGGRTPLGAGLGAAVALVGAATTAATHRPLLVVVTDGRATAAPGGADPVEMAEAAAADIARRGIAAVVVDVEDGPAPLGLAARLATAMGARHLPLSELTPGRLEQAVRSGLR